MVNNCEKLTFKPEGANDIDKIEIQNIRANTIDFTDGNHNYKFNITKSNTISKTIIKRKT